MLPEYSSTRYSRVCLEEYKFFLPSELQINYVSGRESEYVKLKIVGSTEILTISGCRMGRPIESEVKAAFAANRFCSRNSFFFEAQRFQILSKKIYMR